MVINHLLIDPPSRFFAPTLPIGFMGYPWDEDIFSEINDCYFDTIAAGCLRYYPSSYK